MILLLTYQTVFEVIYPLIEYFSFFLSLCNFLLVIQIILILEYILTVVSSFSNFVVVVVVSLLSFIYFCPKGRLILLFAMLLGLLICWFL